MERFINQVDRFGATVGVGGLLGSGALAVLLLTGSAPSQSLAVGCVVVGILLAFAWQSISQG